MPQNAFFLRTRDLLVSQKTTQRHFIFTLHPLSTVIFATATVLAFVLLLNSSFNFHCFTQREATPTQKSARKCAATSRDFFAERLQSAFTLANQLRWIAQYLGSTANCYSSWQHIVYVAGIVNFFVDHTHIQFTEESKMATALTPRLTSLPGSHVTDGEPETVVSASLQKIKSIKNPIKYSLNLKLVTHLSVISTVILHT